MEWLSIIAAIVLAVGGFLFGSKSKPRGQADPGAADKAKEILDDHTEAVEEAGADLADAMADTPDGRVGRVLGWLRTRTGDRKGGQS